MDPIATERPDPASAPAMMGRYGPIEVFRVGSFIPMEGGRQEIDLGTLQEIAASYDPALHPAPCVIGHPEINAPAYGWVERLYVEGGILKATLTDVHSEFADMVRAGRYRRVSISLFLPNSRGNPKPGGFYLRHVGFLGAASPAVSGLKPVSFSDGPGESVEFSQDRPTQDHALADELAQLRRKVREAEVEHLIRDGRVLPVFKDEVVSFAASLDDQETVSFAEGRADTRLNWFLSYLARQPAVVSFGAVDLGPDPFSGHVPPRPAVNAPDGYQVDRRNDDVFAAASLMAREKGISFVAAVDAVIGGEP